MKIKKGDKVKIISGEDRGRVGIINRVFPKTNQIVVDGLNIAKKHVKPTGNREGGIVEINLPFAVSKAMLVCPQCGKPSRVAIKLDKKGEKYRICRQCRSLIDVADKKKA